MRWKWAIAVAFAIAATALPAARGQSKPPFVFTQTDLDLLKESDAFDRQLEARGLAYRAPDLEAYLGRLAAPFLPTDPQEHVAWKFRLLRDPVENAFALPNGSVYVNFGMFARAENDQQIAAVLAHEVVHVTNRHTYLFNRSLRKKAVVAQIAAVAATWTPFGGIAPLIAASATQWAIVVSVYGYSRREEAEADRIAAEQILAQGREVRQMSRVFELLNHKLEAEPVPYLFRDHARLSDRIAAIQAMAPGAQNPAPVLDRDYVVRLRGVMVQDIELDLNVRRFRTAADIAQRLANAAPEDAEAQYWLGEAYRQLGPRRPQLSPKESSDGGLRSGYRARVKRTEAEEYTFLAGKPEGKAALAENQQVAEVAFRRAVQLDSRLPGPYLGLGELYRQQGKKEEAVGAYREFLARSKQAGETARVSQLIGELQK